MSEEVKPESMSLCPVSVAATPEGELLCIFGTGDLGRSLGQRLVQAGYKVVFGSRRPHSCGPLPPGTQVLFQDIFPNLEWNLFPDSFLMIMLLFLLFTPGILLGISQTNSDNCVGKRQSAYLVLVKKEIAAIRLLTSQTRSLIKRCVNMFDKSAMADCVWQLFFFFYLLCQQKIVKIIH